MGCGPSQPSRVYDPNGGVTVKYANAPQPYRPAYVQPYAPPQTQVYVQQQQQPAPAYGQQPMYANNGQYYAQGPPPGQYYGQPQPTVVYANGPSYAPQQQQQQQGGMGVGGAVAMGFIGGMVAAELFD